MLLLKCSEISPKFFEDFPCFIFRHSPKGARAKGAWGNFDIGHTNFIPTTYQRHGVTMTVIDSNVYSASISRKKSAQPKCASCMNHIWAITLFGQARFTPARFAEHLGGGNVRATLRIFSGYFNLKRLPKGPFRTVFSTASDSYCLTTTL